MKPKSFFPLLIITGMFFAINLQAQESDASSIWMHVYGQNPAAANVTFGNRIGNTFGLDTAASYPSEYREQEPPPPMSKGSRVLQGFDVIWARIRASQPWGTFVGLLDRDFRDYTSEAQKDTFKLAFAQNDNTSATISFKWPDPVYLAAHCDSLILRYIVSTTGETVWIDMFSQDSLTIPMAGDIGVSNLFIYKTGIHLVETGVGEMPLPAAVSLAQNFPNPFNPSTEIRYTLAGNQFVNITIFDVLGREVATLVREVQPPGEHSVNWDGGAMPSGMYFYRIDTESFSETRKMILLR